MGTPVAAALRRRPGRRLVGAGRPTTGRPGTGRRPVVAALATTALAGGMVLLTGGPALAGGVPGVPAVPGVGSLPGGGSGGGGSGGSGSGSTGSGGAGGSTSGSGVPATGGSGGNGTDTTLGGFQVTSTAAAVRTTYEQPNFPVPATPTFELNVGFTQSTYGTGPSGESLASVLWPGQVVAGFGGQLNTEIDPYLQPLLGANTPNITLPPWPLQADSAYPAQPSKPATSNQDSSGMAMEAASSDTAGQASASFGNAGTDGPSALPSGFVTVQSMGSTSRADVESNTAVSSATSTMHGISIDNGLISIGAVTSTATATSDGATGKVDGTTTVAQASILGQPVTIGPDGITAIGQPQGTNLLSGLLPPLDSVLKTLGITITAGKATDAVTNATTDNPQASASRELDGVQVDINGTACDKQLNGVVNSLPAQLRTNLISQLPLPLPNAQELVLDLAYVDVQAAATPGFDAGNGGTGTTSSLLGGGGGAGIGGIGLGGAGDLGTGTGTGGLGGDLGGGTVPTAAGATGAGSPTSTAVVPAAARLFTGIGDGLIILGAALGLLLAALLLRADRAVGARAGAPACPDDH
jgi:hypothetical protein